MVGFSWNRIAPLAIALIALGSQLCPGTASGQQVSVDKLQKSCSKKGNLDDCILLGDLYADGKGVRQDARKARELYHRSCYDQGTHRALAKRTGCEKLARLTTDALEADKLIERWCFAHMEACSSQPPPKELDRAFYELTASAAASYLYLRRFPHGAHADLARNRAPFDRASEQDTLTGWVEYLDSKPTTEYAARAEQRVADLVSAEKKELARRFAGESKGQFRKDQLTVEYVHFETDAPDWLYTGGDEAWAWATRQRADMRDFAVLAFLMFYEWSTHREYACRHLLGPNSDIEAHEASELSLSLPGEEDGAKVALGFVPGSEKRDVIIKGPMEFGGKTYDTTFTAAGMEFEIWRARNKGRRVVVRPGLAFIGAPSHYREGAEIEDVGLGLNITTEQGMEASTGACLIEIREESLNLYEVEAQR